MSDRLLGAACVALGAGMAWAASDYAAPISYEPVGPRAFPLLLAGLLAAGGAWLVLRPADGAGVRAAQLKTAGLAMAAILAYALLFEIAGFTLATALMAVPIGMAFGGSWKQSLAGGLGLGIVCFVLFDRLLDVVLPTGWLAFLFGGH